jgi:hypothetical protein
MRNALDRQAARRVIAGLWLALSLSLTCSLASAATSKEASLDLVVSSELLPQYERFFDLLAREGRAATLNGEPIFTGKDKFLPGKIAIGLAHTLLATPSGSALADTRISQYREIARMTLADSNETWGMHYYLLAIYNLKRAGLLERAFDPETLAALRTKLDWRHFVRTPAYTLIDLPSNYYGVAFSIARMRAELGWEDASASRELLDKLLAHYKAHSGEFGFSDETNGEGRYDRYSVLLIAEICQRFIETDLAVPGELKTMLRRSAQLTLNLASATGEGFSFGRSIGAYGDTAFLEILSVAAYLGALDEKEKAYAYALSSRIAKRYSSFWYDARMQSVNLWEKGRRTDAYRGRHRMLGENLSLLHQIVSANALWNRIGFKGAAPKPGLAEWLDATQAKFKLVRFARGEFDQALAVFRDRGHVFSLLMVNGGKGQHDNSPYYPLPFSHGVVSGVADSGAQPAQLVPVFTLADGTRLMATSFIRDIAEANSSGSHVVRFRQDAMNRIGKNQPVADPRIKVRTEYRFSPGRITRTDVYTPAETLKVDQISLEFATFSAKHSVKDGAVRFADGAVAKFTTSGLGSCAAVDAPDTAAFRSPTGSMRSHVTCRTRDIEFSAPITITWTIEYGKA